MKPSKSALLNLALVAAAFVATLAVYGRLPEQVPIHWNVRGEVDGCLAKPLGAFLLPLTMASLYLLLLVLPRLSPTGYRLDKFSGVYGLIQTAILAFLLLTTLAALLAGLGVAVPMERIIPAGLGLLFIVLGNYLAKVRKNFFVGIRTPWTLASDEVWLRTHRLAGRLFVLAGLLVLASAFTGGTLIAAALAVTLAAVVPIVYSYVVYRRLDAPDAS